MKRVGEHTHFFFLKHNQGGTPLSGKLSGSDSFNLTLNIFVALFNNLSTHVSLTIFSAHFVTRMMIFPPPPRTKISAWKKQLQECINSNAIISTITR